MRTHLDRPKGFTLVELSIAMGVSALVVLAAVALMLSQQRSFRSSSDDRALQEIGRIALGRISADLRSAGFGVDPAVAFDFGPMDRVRLAMSPKGEIVKAGGFRPCGTGWPGCRDRIDGPDEIVFLSRDPLFGKPLRVGLTASSTEVEVVGPLRVPLRRGQILQVLCYTAPMAWAYLTVREDVPASAAAATSVKIPIEAGNSFDFPLQNKALGDLCFSKAVTSAAPTEAEVEAAAKVMKVDRYRYFIERYDGRPYLMLDRGGPDGARQLEVIAPDVEDLQFAYVFPNALDAPLVGATPGTPIVDTGQGIELAPAEFPAYGDAPRAAAQTNHQAGNIRAVRVSVVVRSPNPDPNILADGVIPAAGNRAETAATGGDRGYRRLLLETTVPVPNLGARAPYFPFYGSPTQAMNVGGG